MFNVCQIMLTIVLLYLRCLPLTEGLQGQAKFCYIKFRRGCGFPSIQLLTFDHVVKFVSWPITTIVGKIHSKARRFSAIVLNTSQNRVYP